MTKEVKMQNFDFGNIEIFLEIMRSSKICKEIISSIVCG